MFASRSPVVAEGILALRKPRKLVTPRRLPRSAMHSPPHRSLAFESSVDSRGLRLSQTIRGHVADSVAGESFDRVEVDRDLSRARDYRVAKESTGVWAARFCVSCRAGGGVCRWLLLAGMSLAWPGACQQCGLLDEEVRGEPASRPAGDSHVEAARVTRGADLGVLVSGGWAARGVSRDSGAGCGRPQDGQRAAHTMPRVSFEAKELARNNFPV